MTKPHLTGANFSPLHHGMGTSSSGTVTGTTIAAGDAVRIAGSGNKKWKGSVTSSAGGNNWNATVKRTGSVTAASTKSAKGGKGAKGAKIKVIPFALETVTVTVTN